MNYWLGPYLGKPWYKYPLVWKDSTVDGRTGVYRLWVKSERLFSLLTDIGGNRFEKEGIKRMVLLSWVMLAIGLVGFGLTFPLWLTDRIDDRMMLGITLALSWAALWYTAILSIYEAKNEDKRER